MRAARGGVNGPALLVQRGRERPLSFDDLPDMYFAFLRDDVE
jgi:hypothetical protein